MKFFETTQKSVTEVPILAVPISHPWKVWVAEPSESLSAGDRHGESYAHVTR